MIISSTHIFRFNKLFFLFLFKITGCKSPIFHKFLISIVFSIEFFFLEHSTTLLLLDCSSILSLNPKPLPLAAMLRRRRGRSSSPPPPPPRRAPWRLRSPPEKAAAQPPPCSTPSPAPPAPSTRFAPKFERR